ncbi:hypothetical protein [Kitasatospora sp. MBT66]|uniref:hypothetical protein n=1 Tax=Kitasatospora sp. MBT66 TaxID=1444769 RepID=UPI0005BB115A|nr:hypothetical protein [Kitasatospora sp. MBT66]
MRESLLRLLPARLARRLGYHLALHDPAALAVAIENNLAAARAGHDVELRAALRKLTVPLEFQPGLLDLHQESAEIVIYLCGVAAASETNLDLHDPRQRALYRALLDALTASEKLRTLVAEATLLALPADESSAELQHL